MHALRYSVRTLISLRALRSVQACKYERNDECREKLATLESRHRGPLNWTERRETPSVTHECVASFYVRHALPSGRCMDC